VALDARALAAEPWPGLWRRHRATAERWARAVTNRRVGVALSGGGACAYRTLPLLRALAAAGVPLDVVSGVSGGALMGAYLCAGGVAGLARAERRGRRFLLAMLGAIVWSGCIERVLDHDLGSARVEQLETLFAPVTTELGDPPGARIVSAGTIGEAVRASAAAPVLFGPTRKGGRRYADGAAATMLPAAVLTGCGADLTLACTCVPPPTRGNPFGRTLVTRLVHRWVRRTPLGRLVDAWVATSMLLHTASRLAGRDAQVSWQPSGVHDPLGEALRFDRADAIVADAAVRDRASIARAVTQVRALWRELGV
jgi:NTE family protein